MHRCTTGLLALGAGLAVIGCSGESRPSPAAPHVNAFTTSSPTCDFEAVTSLAATYFGRSDEGEIVENLIDEMQTAFDEEEGVTTTRDRGFDVMSRIASQVKAGNGGFQAASSLTNALLACMKFTPEELPATFPEDFTIATDPARDGAYDVRGKPGEGGDPNTDPRQRVYSRPTSFAENGFPTGPEGFSGVAPALSGSTVLSWSDVIVTAAPPTRILLYGQPGSNTRSYDWRAVPRNVSYQFAGGPGALVGLCVASTRSLVHESGTTFSGFNSFADAYFMDPAICQTFAFERSRWSPPRFLASLFSVPPIWANPGGIGGLIGGHSQFDGDVTQMAATFTQQPPRTVRVCTPVSPTVAGCPSDALFQVAVAATGTGTRADGTVDMGGVGPASVHLTAVNNNGTFKRLCQLTDNTNTTFVCDPVGDFTGTNITQSSGGPPGFTPATFTNLFFTEPGAERLVANGRISGTSITSQSTSNKVNVKP